MKNSILCVALLSALGVAHAGNVAATKTLSSIPWNEIGAKAGTDYKGNGLAVTPAAFGARLHCVFQRLDGEAMPEGLWLTSTVTNAASERFRVTALAVGRKAWSAGLNSPDAESTIALPDEGQVCLEGQTVRFNRPGLTEDYSVSMDGVRQDFIVEQAPPSPLGQPEHELVVSLAVTGARVEAAPAPYGARLVLENSGRQIAYSRLRVTDAMGKELPARIEVCPVGDETTSLNNSCDLFGNDFEEVTLLTSLPRSSTLAVVVEDAEAVYPVRIDPTFSDANWSALGSGMGGSYAAVRALAVSGGTLYAGGTFTTAGGSAANCIAQWNGTSWSALGSGMGGGVSALAVSGNTLYAGGGSVAQWNGSSWSVLGSGVNGGVVQALAVSGSTLYAGGTFTTAGGATANSIAQWNGSSWSALGSGMGGSYAEVWALAVSGGTLYAGGYFTTAGGSAANYIAQWNGSSWSALGSGMGGAESVNALAVSGSTLYAGGYFTTAGGSAANCIAQWNGSSWSALGSGVNSTIWAVAVSGSTLYVGGIFTMAGTNASYYVAMANLGGTPVSVTIITNAAFGFTNGVFGFDVSGPSGSNVVVQASSNLQTWIPLQTNLLGSGLLYFSDSQSPTNRQRFYRAQLLP